MTDVKVFDEFDKDVIHKMKQSPSEIRKNAVLNENQAKNLKINQGKYVDTTS
jgi:hypothetical protein